MALPGSKGIPVESNYPQMVYHLGLTKMQDEKTKKFTSAFTGFVVEIGKNPEFDEAAEAANWPKVTFQHPRQGKDPIQVEYWNFEDRIEIFPFFIGVPAAKLFGIKGKAEAFAQDGGVFYWTTKKNERGEPKGESHLEFLAAIAVGNTMQLVQISAKSLNSQHLLTAMVQHLETVATLNELRDKAKRPDEISPVEVILPLISAENTVSFGQNDLYPIAYGGPEVVTLDWAKKALASKAVYPLLEGFWSVATQWASQRLNDRQHMGGASYEETPARESVYAPVPAMAEDPNDPGF